MRLEVQTLFHADDHHASRLCSSKGMALTVPFTRLLSGGGVSKQEINVSELPSDARCKPCDEYWPLKALLAVCVLSLRSACRRYLLAVLPCTGTSFACGMGRLAVELI
jgi:hypothetical protein